MENKDKLNDIKIYNGVKWININLKDITEPLEKLINDQNNKIEILEQQIINIEKKQNNFINKLRRAYKGVK